MSGTCLKNREESKKRKRKEAAAPHVYTFDDSADVESRRRASQAVLNRGLTRCRPKENKAPSTKNKAAYATSWYQVRLLVST